MTETAADALVLPRGLDDIDAAFMTQVLRRNGVISPTNEVVSQVEAGVGMTAGYFSSIKTVCCAYREPTDAPTRFVAKAWPSLELAPKDNIAGMFTRISKATRSPRTGSTRARTPTWPPSMRMTGATF